MGIRFLVCSLWHSNRKGSLKTWMKNYFIQSLCPADVLDWRTPLFSQFFLPAPLSKNVPLATYSKTRTWWNESGHSEWPPPPHDIRAGETVKWNEWSQNLLWGSKNEHPLIKQNTCIGDMQRKVLKYCRMTTGYGLAAILCQFFTISHNTAKENLFERSSRNFTHIAPA